MEGGPGRRIRNLHSCGWVKVNEAKDSFGHVIHRARAFICSPRELIVPATPTFQSRHKQWGPSSSHCVLIFPVTHDRYEGCWKKNFQEGRGQEVWKDGCSYQGMYRQSRKNGFGKFEWSDGSYYSGQFRDNELHGFGTYQWAGEPSTDQNQSVTGVAVSPPSIAVFL